MSTTALHIIELVKSLPLPEQQAIYSEMARYRSELLARQSHGSAARPRMAEEGIPNDHAFFTILEADEAARRRDFGPPPPDFN